VPRLAVNMMVLNGAAVLRRCLLPLRGVVDELVVADTGSTDGTKQVLEEIATELGLARYRYERLHPCSPAFLTDEQETWRRPLPGPFTGRRVPKDWAAIRNGVLDETTADYVLKLDADDEPVCPPENWLRTCDTLDAKQNVDVLYCPYDICDGRGNVTWRSMYARLWRRVSGSGPSPRWTQSCHEMLSGVTAQRTIYAAAGLRVRDHRDSPGEGVRIAHRNLKVLLWNRENGDRVTCSPESEAARRDLLETFTLAHEAAEVLPELAHELLANVLLRLDKTDVTMLSDCHYHMGRAYEAHAAVAGLGASLLLKRAEESYRRADEVSSHPQALLKLHALLMREGKVEAARLLRPEILAKIGQSPYNYDLVLAAEVVNMETKDLV